MCIPPGPCLNIGITLDVCTLYRKIHANAWICVKNKTCILNINWIRIRIEPFFVRGALKSVVGILLSITIRRVETCSFDCYLSMLA